MLSVVNHSDGGVPQASYRHHLSSSKVEPIRIRITICSGKKARGNYNRQLRMSGSMASYFASSSSCHWLVRTGHLMRNESPSLFPLQDSLQSHRDGRQHRSTCQPRLKSNPPFSTATIGNALCSEAWLWCCVTRIDYLQNMTSALRAMQCTYETSTMQALPFVLLFLPLMHKGIPQCTAGGRHLGTTAISWCSLPSLQGNTSHGLAEVVQPIAGHPVKY